MLNKKPSVCSRKVNIMHVTTCLNRGGLETVVLHLLTSLGRHTYRPLVCTFTPGGSLEPAFRELDIPVITLVKRPRLDYSLTWRLRQVLRREKVDILHTHNCGPWFYGGVAAKLAGVPCLVHTEHSNVAAQRGKMLVAERYLARITDAVVADCSKVAQQLINNQGLADQKVKIIYNGVNLDTFQQNGHGGHLKDSLGIAPHSQLIGCVARLAPVKDHPTLLKAFLGVKRRIKNAKLLLMGDGEQRPKIEELISHLGMNNDVILTGFRSDVSNLLQTIDVFALASKSEGMPLAIIEAMAAEKPVVATRVGGITELVVEGETGHLVDPQDAEGMTRALVDLLENPSRAVALGKKGRQRAEELFSLAHTVNQYEEVYRGCLEQKGLIRERV